MPMNCLWLIWPILGSHGIPHQVASAQRWRYLGVPAANQPIIGRLCYNYAAHGGFIGAFWIFLHDSIHIISHQCFPHTSSHIIATPRKWTQKHSKKLPWSALKLAWQGVVSPTTHHHGVLLSCKDTSGKRTTRIWRTTLCPTTWKDCWRQKQELTKGPMETEEHIFFCWHPILCDGDDQNQPQNWAGVILNFEACALWLEEPHSADMPQPPNFQ